MARKIKRRSKDAAIEQLLTAARALASGDPAGARSVAAPVLEAAPERLDALELMTLVALAEEAFEEALSFADRALAGEPSAKRHVVRAQALRELGRLAEADSALDAALRVDPADASIYEQRARVRLAAGELAEALHEAEGALALDAGRLGAHGLKAGLLAELGRVDEAVSTYRDAVRAREGAPGVRAELLEELAELLESRGEESDAEEATQARGLAAALRG